MSASKESPFSVTFKTDESYAAGMLTVRGDTGEELEARLEELTGVLDKVVDVKSLLLAANRVASPAPAAAPDATVTQAAQPAAGQGPDVKTCAHGVRVFKSGTSSRGPWSAWMCPMPKNATDKCDPLWNN